MKQISYKLFVSFFGFFILLHHNVQAEMLHYDHEITAGYHEVCEGGGCEHELEVCGKIDGDGIKIPHTYSILPEIVEIKYLADEYILGGAHLKQNILKKISPSHQELARSHI